MERNAQTLPSNTNCLNTITKLNIRSIIMAVANIIHAQIIDVQFFNKDLENPKTIDPNSDLFLFSEEKYIIERSDEFDEDRC